MNEQDKVVPIKKKATKSRATIDELEALLNSDEDIDITILPNGEVVTKPGKKKTGPLKPLTFREKLGGEYGSQIRL